MQKTVFVGRERELAELKACLDQALSGAGRVCFVSGQAGTGKSALVQQFVQQAFATDPKLVAAMGTCNAQAGIGDPYLPFREALVMLTDEVAAQQAAGKLSPQNTNRLRPILARSVQVLVEVAPDLVGVLVPGATLAGAVGKAVAKKVGWMDKLDKLAERGRQAGTITEPTVDQSRIFEQVTAFLRQLSEKAPLILFLDDLQWADGASLSLLFHLGRHIETSRILVLGAYRPDDVALGRDGKRHPLEPVTNELTRYYGDVTVDLDSIPEEASHRFVEALLDAEPNCLGKEFRRALYHQTGGHALFTVELVQTMKERGDLVRNVEGCWVEGWSLDWSTLPARVEGVIEERIQRLSRELREMLQTASVLGEVFGAEIVARIQNMAERDTIWQLSRELQRKHRLVVAEGLVDMGRIRLSRYRFVHNLFQHYLYESMAEAERVYLHRDAAQVLESMFDGETAPVAGQLAHHFERAGMVAKAAAYRLQAGNQARRLSALPEARAHLNRGLALVARLDTGPEQMMLELDLQVSLGMVLLAMYGYASPEADQAFAHARDLCRRLGDPPQTMQVLLAQAVFYLMRGELERACEGAEQVRRRALEDNGLPPGANTRYRLTAHLLLGAGAMYLAHYGTAQEHLEQAVALYDPIEHRDLAYQQGQDPGVQAMSFLSRVLWFQGYPEQAVALADKAFALAQALDHPYSLTIATLHRATLHAFLGQWPECQASSETAIRLAREGGFRMRQAHAAVLHGIALARQGRTQEGIEELTEGLFMWEATGAGLVVYPRACLAEACWIAGRVEEGLRAVDEALYPGEEAWWLPEEYRLRAELLLQVPDGESEAEALLWQAVELARTQGSRSLELRTLTSLVRLLQQQGREAEGLDQLAGCYGWFTEGLDLPDLQEARKLLAERS